MDNLPSFGEMQTFVLSNLDLEDLESEEGYTESKEIY
jgi:hypothetical protein